jgi:hypothetical protein
MTLANPSFGQVIYGQEKTWTRNIIVHLLPAYGRFLPLTTHGSSGTPQLTTHSFDSV